MVTVDATAILVAIADASILHPRPLGPSVDQSYQRLCFRGERGWK